MKRSVFVVMIVAVIAATMVASASVANTDVLAKKGEADNHISDQGREHMSDQGKASAGISDNDQGDEGGGGEDGCSGESDDCGGDDSPGDECEQDQECEDGRPV